MPCGTLCLGMRISVLMVVFATFCAEWIHKTQVVPHTGRTATKGEMRLTHCDYNGILGRVWTPSFFVLFGCPHQDRSSPLMRSVLPLLSQGHLEHSEWVKRRGHLTPEEMHSSGGFFLRSHQLCGVLTQNPEIVPTRNRFAPDPLWEWLSWVVLSGPRRSQQKCWGKCWWNPCLRWRVRPRWSPVVLFGPQLQDHPLRSLLLP